MSSDAQSALLELQVNTYGSLAIAISISYDYCLTFSKEVTYIWERPWTRVSALFLFIRYVGLLSAIVFALNESAFIQGPLKVRMSRDVVYLLTVWARAIFLASADMVMILRVYAMYNRSRTVLGVLLMIYITEVVVLLVSSSTYSNAKHATVSIVPLLHVTVCNVIFHTRTWNNVSTIVQFVLGTVLCILVIAKFTRESLEMYRVTQQWQLDRYMRLLVRDGLLYFVVTFVNALLTMIWVLGILPQGWLGQVLAIVANVPLYTLTPRFVMNIRELYVLDVQGRLGCDIGVDTGFGLPSGTWRGVGTTAAVGAMAPSEGGGIGEAEGAEITVV